MRKLISFFSHILMLVPNGVWQFFSKLLTWFWFDLIRFRRQIVMDNIKRVFPYMSPEDSQVLAKKSIFYLFYNYFEFFRLPGISEEWISKNVSFHNLNRLDLALEKKRGVLMLSLHLGHGDLAISMLAHRGYKMNVISKTFKMKLANDIWFTIRKYFGAKFIEPHGSATPFEILKALKSKESVVFVLDQYMGPPYGLETTFFGIKTGTAYGLALFALKSKAPVVPVFSYHDEFGKSHISVGEEIVFEDRGDKDATLLYMTQKYNHVLEKLISEHPSDWMWIHRRWKNFW